MSSLLDNKYFVKGLILTLIHTILSSISLYFIIVAIYSFLETSGGYMNMYEQWNTDLISNIVECNPVTLKPTQTNYTVTGSLQRAWLGKFPGISTGCDCRGYWSNSIN